MNSLRLEATDSQLDYVVDDLPLWDWIALVTGEETLHGRRSTTPFGPPVTRNGQRRFYEMLAGKRPGDVPGGRVPLYVCDHCADYGCGVTSVILRQTAASVSWSGFAVGSPQSVLVDVPELHFDKAQYISALSAVA